MNYDWERGDPRRTKIIDHPEVPMTSPNGTPDSALTEAEARLWLLSEAERKAKMGVRYNTGSERWERSSEIFPEKFCRVCKTSFTSARSTAVFCSDKCRKAQARKVYSPAKPGGTA